TAQDAAAYLGTRSMNDLIKAGTPVKWDRLPPGPFKYSDLGDVPPDTKIIWMKLPPFKGEVIYAAVADSATDGMGQILLGASDGSMLATAISVGPGRWNKTMTVDPS